MSLVRTWILLSAFVAAAFVGSCGLAAAEMPEAPPLSTLVPAADLVDEIEEYVEKLEDYVEDEEEYKFATEKVDPSKPSNLEEKAHTLTVLALAVGLHDQDSSLKKASPALVAACQDVADAQDYPSARAAVQAVKAAMSSNGDPSSLKWTKVASLPPLMGEVPLINSRLKRYVRQFERGAKYIKGGAATVAVIAHGSMPNADETGKPDAIEEWFKYCVEMRDAASALNKAAHAGSEDAAKEAMEALQKSCDDCHTVFHKEALGK